MEIQKEIEGVDRAAAGDGNLYEAWLALVEKLGEAGFPPLVPHEIYHRLAPLSFNAAEAIAQMAITRAVNARVLSGYYRQNLVVLATLEKSASTMHEVCINEMLHDTKGVAVFVPTSRQDIAGPSHLGGSAAFSAAMLLFFPNGGTLRGAFEPSGTNMEVLSDIGSKIIVLTRHPADRIVAQYCMRSHEFAQPAPFQSVFADGDNLPVTVEPLVHTLRWITGWKRRSIQNRLIGIFRYEDMVNNPVRHFTELHHFLFETEPSARLIQKITQLHDRVVISDGAALQSGDTSSRLYKYGWTGKVGVWNSYLNAADVASYNEVVSSFLSNDPQGRFALDVYPNIILQTQK